MSSLSAARADNYYYPREWRPELGSINQFQGSHPLGKRAKDLATTGVLVVRFEMPFNVWCTHCETHIGRGVRFNAKKKKCDMYFTTILYEFALTCAHCQGEMVMRTDPEHRGYKLVSGVRKKVEGADVVSAYDTTISGDGDTTVIRRADDIGTERLNDPHVGVMLQTDPFFRLEHENEDKRVANQRVKGLEALLELKDARDKDNYASNASLRSAFRSQKKQIKRREDEGAKRGLSIPLLDVHEDDVVAAKAVVYKNIPGKKRGVKESNGQQHQRGHSGAIVLHKPQVSSNASKAKNGSFQHFGDAIGSQLHRMKQAKRLAQQHQQKVSMPSMGTSGSGSSSKKRKASSGGTTSLAARASKLLRR